MGNIQLLFSSHIWINSALHSGCPGLWLPRVYRHELLGIRSVRYSP